MEANQTSSATKSRKRRSAQEKLAYCEAWQRSGLSRSEFCQREGLALPTLCAWLKKHLTTAILPPQALQFTAVPEVTLKQPEEQMLEIKLTNGLQCRFSRIVDIKQLCKIIGGLQRVTTD